MASEPLSARIKRLRPEPTVFAHQTSKEIWKRAEQEIEKRVAAAPFTKHYDLPFFTDEVTPVILNEVVELSQKNGIAASWIVDYNDEGFKDCVDEYKLQFRF